MKLRQIRIRDFTLFEDVAFDFAPGVNVFIGENGTGKSHLFKLLYVLIKAAREVLSDQLTAFETRSLRKLLQEVFQPDSFRSFSPGGGRKPTITLSWEQAELHVVLDEQGVLKTVRSGDASEIQRPLFLPSREVLSIFPGFVAAWLHRESAFDSTYFDLCKALELMPLKSGGSAELLKPIAAELGGTVRRKGDQFYVEYDGAEREAPMLGDGDRRLAMLAHLIMNGSLSENTCLLWEEPEASLNPRRARLAADVAANLAREGAQVLLATHDYTISSELTLMADTGALKDSAFFSLYRDRSDEGVKVERGERLAEIEHNPMLDAIADLHDREELAAFPADVP
jgi:hypothetical protein